MEIDKNKIKNINKSFNMLAEYNYPPEVDRSKFGIFNPDRIPKDTRVNVNGTMRTLVPGRGFFHKLSASYDDVMETMGNNVINNTNSIKDTLAAIKENIVSVARTRPKLTTNSDEIWEPKYKIDMINTGKDPEVLQLTNLLQNSSKVAPRSTSSSDGNSVVITLFNKCSDSFVNITKSFENDPSNKVISDQTNGGTTSGFVGIIKSRTGETFELIKTSGAVGGFGFIWNILRNGFSQLTSYIFSSFETVQNFLSQSSDNLSKSFSDDLKSIKVGNLPLISLLIWSGGATVFSLLLYKIVKWFKKKQSLKGYVNEGYYDITVSDLAELNEYVLNNSDILTESTTPEQSKEMIDTANDVEDTINKKKDKTVGDSIGEFFNLLFKLILTVSLVGRLIRIALLVITIVATRYSEAHQG
jgi:hypothetical protein